MSLYNSDDDRRQFPRYAKSISVDINGRVFPVYKKMEEAAAGKDISVSGLAFISPASHEIGARLSMTVRITNQEQDERESGLTVSRASHPIVTEAEVVRVDFLGEGLGYEVGVRFTNISEEDYRILIRHLARE